MSTALIPLTNTDEGQQAVLGRDLWEFLEVKDEYSHWFEDMCSYGFSAGQDFSGFSPNNAGRGRPRKDHILTLDMAKELSMIQRTEKGKQARRYFIECERQAKEAAQSPAIPQTYAEALRAAADNYERAEIAEREAEEQAEIARLAEEELEAQAPAVSYYDTFVDERGALSFADVASTIGVKQSEMRQQLLDHNWIFRQRAWKRSASTGKRVPDYLYCERADKKPYFIRKKRHNAPLWKGRVRHTLFITPAGAEAIDRAMYRWADTDDAEDQEVLW